jgi:membrane protein YqaA with SNARE-associated domain
MSVIGLLQKLLAPAPGESRRTHIIQIIVLLVTIGLTAFIVLNYQSIESETHIFRDYGYLSAFLIALVSSGSIVVPVPGVFLLAALGSMHVLNPVLLGLVAAVGSTLGEMTGYGLGFGGRIAVEKVPKYDLVVGWMTRWGSATIFILSLIPNPIFDVAGIAAGALKFPLWKFLVWGFLGRIPKTIMYVYFGVWFSAIFHVS